MSYFKIINGSNILNSILFIILGLFLIISPNIILNTINIIFSIFFMLAGIIEISNFFTLKDFGFKYTHLIAGIGCILLSIVCINMSQILETVLRIVIAIWMLYTGIKRLNFSILLFKTNLYGQFFVLLLSTILMFVLGIYILITPNFLTVTLGVIILVYSVVDLIDSILFMINYKKIFD